MDQTVNKRTFKTLGKTIHIALVLMEKDAKAQGIVAGMTEEDLVHVMSFAAYAGLIQGAEGAKTAVNDELNRLIDEMTF